MNAKAASGALNKAIEQIKKDKQEEKAEGPSENMMGGPHMGKFESPMGSGVVIKSKPSYEEPKGEPAMVDHHHFLTHDTKGERLALPQHFVVSAPHGSQ